MQSTDSNTDSHDTTTRKGTGILNVVKSTLAAALGVQSNANRERDFQHGSPKSFVIAGIVFVLLFIVMMYGIVQLVLKIAS